MEIRNGVGKRFPQSYVGAPDAALPLQEPLDSTADMGKLALVHVNCCVCGADEYDRIAVGEDFEYRTSDDVFYMVRCRQCTLVYLNPRPADSEFKRIYPSTYHAFAFTPERFGFVYRIRRRLEARRLLLWCRGLPLDARILDVGCGDGFHLDLLREFAPRSYRLEGVDADSRAAAVARARGLIVHCGMLDDLPLEGSSYDFVFAIQTIEHVGAPRELLAHIRQLLRPGGRVVIVTDNADSFDSRLFAARYWGGYHFPRHWNLFSSATLARLAARARLRVVRSTTIVSPVNWVYSLRNALVDARAPAWLVERFSLSAPESLAPFTILDSLCQVMGRGALLCAMLEREE